MAKNIVYKSKTVIKGPRAATMNGFAILNGSGEFWTPKLFETKAQAKAYFDEFWKLPGFENAGPTWSRYKVVPAKTRITATMAKGGG